MKPNKTPPTKGLVAVVWHALFASLHSSGLERTKRGGYRMISFRGCGNSFPHGVPATPECGWGTIKCFGDEPSGLRPQSRLTPEPSSEETGGDCVSRLVMPSDMYARFTHQGWDAVDEEIRKHFKIPKNRYYSVTVPPSPVGRVIIDHARTRTIESVKLSKSDISEHNA